MMPVGRRDGPGRELRHADEVEVVEHLRGLGVPRLARRHRRAAAVRLPCTRPQRRRGWGTADRPSRRARRPPRARPRCAARRRASAPAPRADAPTAQAVRIATHSFAARTHRCSPTAARTRTPATASARPCSSGVTRRAAPATSERPVVTATYCLPSTANDTGKPLTGAPRFVSQSTLPVVSSNAWKLPATSPPNTSPPPVAASDITPVRCSCFHSVVPFSAEIAQTTPTFSAPGRRDVLAREAVHEPRIALAALDRGVHAHVLHRHVHRVRARAVRAGRPVLTAVRAGAHHERRDPCA